jgi:hypothetical protein
MFQGSASGDGEAVSACTLKSWQRAQLEAAMRQVREQSAEPFKGREQGISERSGRVFADLSWLRQIAMTTLIEPQLISEIRDYRCGAGYRAIS